MQRVIPWSAQQVRRFSLWSMKKDPDLESALTRNRRWIVNNQIKNLVLRHPDRALPVTLLQKKFKTLDLRGNALNWLRKYPCCFAVDSDPSGNLLCRLTKRMGDVAAAEQAAMAAQEPAAATRLAKLLMMSSGRRLNAVKLNELKRGLGLPDDYLVRIVPARPELFRVVNRGLRRSSMEIELVSWDPSLAVSAVEASARERRADPGFQCSLPATWVKAWERFRQFESNAPYVSPYSDPKAQLDYAAAEKRAVGVVHELLSLSLWKKASMLKLGHFRREFGLPDRLNVMLLKHPGIFYVTNKYRVYTVLLREAYDGSVLVEKDPLVVAKERLGELMQEGLHEYNRRRCLLNLEKKRKNGPVLDDARKSRRSEVSDDDEDEGEEDNDSNKRLGGLFDPEERKRFYKVLFEEDK